MFVGDNLIDKVGTFYNVIEGEAHPDFSFHPTDPSQIRNDIGILQLETAPDVDSIPIRRTPMTDAEKGSQVRSVGFGVTSGSGIEEDEGAGLKRTGTLVLQTDSYPNDEQVIAFPSPALICSGDSGGPSFINVNGVETQFGIHSWGDAKCVAKSGFERVDVHIDTFIGPFIATFAEELCEDGAICTPDHVAAIRSENGGGCSSSNSNSGLALLLTLGAFCFAVRRRVGVPS